jgi:hypothetical protein
MQSKAGTTDSDQQVARLGSDQLRLAWAQPTTAPLMAIWLYAASERLHGCCRVGDEARGGAAAENAARRSQEISQRPA